MTGDHGDSIFSPWIEEARQTDTMSICLSSCKDWGPAFVPSLNTDHWKYYWYLFSNMETSGAVCYKNVNCRRGLGCRSQYFTEFEPSTGQIIIIGIVAKDKWTSENKSYHNQRRASPVPLLRDTFQTLTTAQSTTNVLMEHQPVTLASQTLSENKSSFQLVLLLIDPVSAGTWWPTSATGNPMLTAGSTRTPACSPPPRATTRWIPRWAIKP